MRDVFVTLLCLTLAACGGDPTRTPGSCDGPCPMSKIDHLIVLVQENHTFDNYYAHYCTAPAGTNPTCTSGPDCCEAGPATEPGGASPTVLDDNANATYDPDHTQACEVSETNGGAMDRYVTGAGACSNPGNFAYAEAATVQSYWDLAAQGALADHWFQPIAGQSSSNDMYLARAQFVFVDNANSPDAIGAACSVVPHTTSFPGPTIGDLLNDAGVSWSFYAQGYQAMVDAQANGTCPDAPPECHFGLGIYPCTFDPSDIPTDYYANLADDPRSLRDYDQLQQDLDDLNLPQVAIVRAAGFRSEHPGLGDTISDGVAFTNQMLAAVAASQYAPDTLILITWDEGGGYFDHIAPPGNGSDGQPYGTRVPTIALGPFVSANTISHVPLEHSSIVKFIEWNWLGGATGQLAGRDVDVGNLGSLLDPAATGTAVPE